MVVLGRPNLVSACGLYILYKLYESSLVEHKRTCTTVGRAVNWTDTKVVCRTASNKATAQRTTTRPTPVSTYRTPVFSAAAAAATSASREYLDKHKKTITCRHGSTRRSNFVPTRRDIPPPDSRIFGINRWFDCVLHN